jgi:hypothetical protein
MDVTVTPRRDRVARHSCHYKIDCLASAPAGVKAKSRRSVRAAQRAELLDLVAEALDERYAVQAEAPSE